MNHGCITTNPNQSVLQWNENVPVHVQPKSLRLHHRLCLPFLGFSGSTVGPFAEAWWKCEFCIVLWSSVEASGCNSQKTSRPIGKRGTASSWQCQTPYRPSNPGENSRTTVGTSWTSALQSRLGLWWVPPVWSAKKNHVDGKYFADDEEVETEVRKWLRQQSKDFYAAGFHALVKWRNKCISVGGGYVEKYIFFSGSNTTGFTFCIHLWPLLTLPRNLSQWYFPNSV
jgi:hypothetical protein